MHKIVDSKRFSQNDIIKKLFPFWEYQFSQIVHKQIAEHYTIIFNIQMMWCWWSLSLPSLLAVSILISFLYRVVYILYFSFSHSTCQTGKIGENGWNFAIHTRNGNNFPIIFGQCGKIIRIKTIIWITVFMHRRSHYLNRKKFACSWWDTQFYYKDSMILLMPCKLYVTMNCCFVCLRFVCICIS